MRSTSTTAIAALATSATASLYGESKLNHTCALVPDYLSCSKEADPSYVDSCCVETFGGLVVQTQFWDTYTGLERQGQLLPDNSWTIHGLWPDFCNGSYTAYCDLSRQFDPSPSPNTTDNGTFIPPYNGSNIGTFLEPFGAYDLLAYMNTYWISQGSPNPSFWAHEFSKHATCYSTFDLPCYGPKYIPHEDVLDFFSTVVKYFKQRPTYSWLAAHGIEPSNSTRYTLSDMQNALTQEYGAMPYLGCSGPRFNETAAGANSTDSGRTVLDEAWYYSHVYGPVRNAQDVHIDQTGSSGCATSEGAIWYYERSNGSVRYPY